MFENKKELKKRVRELVGRIEFTENLKRKKWGYLDEIRSKQKKGEISYGDYENLRNRFLEGKSMQEWAEYYNKCILVYRKHLAFYRGKLIRANEEKVVLRVLPYLFLIGVVVFSLFLFLYSFSPVVKNEIVSFAPAQGFYEDCGVGLGSRWIINGNDWGSLVLQGRQCASIPDGNKNMTSYSLDLSNYVSANLSQTFAIYNVSNSSAVSLYVNNGTDEVKIYQLAKASGTKIVSSKSFLLENYISLSNNMSLIYNCKGLGTQGYCLLDDINLAGETNPNLISSCTNLDIANNVYNLTGDINAVGDCINVNADNIVLDGKNFSIIGDGTGIGINISKDLGVRNFTLKNIKVNNFLTSVNAKGIGIQTNTKLFNSEVEQIISPGIFGNLQHGGNVFLYDSNVTKRIDVHGGNGPDIDGALPGDGGNVYIKSNVINISSVSFVLGYGVNNLGGRGIAGRMTINYTEAFDDSNVNYGSANRRVRFTLINGSVNGGWIKWEKEFAPGIGFRLSDNVNISNNFISVGSSSLNSLANVTLNGLRTDFVDPVIKKDGLICTDCYNFTSLNAGKVVFNVSGFSSYMIDERIGKDTIPPNVDFIFPTPLDGSSQMNQDIYVNLSSNDSADYYSFLDFDRDLNLWMRFDDINSSGSPIDLSTYENNGSLFGNAFINDFGYWGKGIQFDGQDDYVNVNGLDKFNTNFSVSLWFNPKNFDDNSQEDIIGTTSGPSGSIGWVLRGLNCLNLPCDLQVRARNETNSNGGADLSFSVNGVINSLDKWNNVVVVYDLNGSSELYLNGVLSAQGSLPTNGFYFPGRSLNFGKIGSGGTSTRAFNGSIDEILVFNRTLTGREISSLYNSSVKDYENNFTNLDFGNHNFIGHAVDSSGNKNDTTLRNVIISSSSLVPEIKDISNIPYTDILPGGIRNVAFNVSVYDGNGFNDISKVNATFSPPTDSIIRTNSSCVKNWDDGNFVANYSCTIGIWYFDEPSNNNGDWSVNASAIDVGSLISQPYNETFVLGAMSPEIVSPGLSWSVLLSPGGKGFVGNPIVLNNTGNANISAIYINGSALVGVSDSSYSIASANFSVNTISSCGGDVLVDNLKIIITNAILPRGNNSMDSGDENSGQEKLWYCAENIPLGLPAQEYKANNNLPSRPWDITFFAFFARWVGVIFVFPIIVKKKKELLELAKKLSNEELLEILNERLKVSNDKDEIKIPVSIFSGSVSPAESLCKYLKDNLGMKFNEIAKLIGRDQRTIWTNYNNAKNKKVKISTKESVMIPLNVLSNRKLSVLESVVYYLRNEGYNNSMISKMLNRDSRNIWTLYSRAKKKLQ